MENHEMPFPPPIHMPPPAVQMSSPAAQAQMLPMHVSDYVRASFSGNAASMWTLYPPSPQTAQFMPQPDLQQSSSFTGQKMVYNPQTSHLHYFRSELTSHLPMHQPIGMQQHQASVFNTSVDQNKCTSPQYNDYKNYAQPWCNTSNLVQQKPEKYGPRHGNLHGDTSLDHCHENRYSVHGGGPSSPDNREFNYFPGQKPSHSHSQAFLPCGVGRKGLNEREGRQWPRKEDDMAKAQMYAHPHIKDYANHKLSMKHPLPAESPSISLKRNVSPFSDDENENFSLRHSGKDGTKKIISYPLTTSITQQRKKVQDSEALTPLEHYYSADSSPSPPRKSLALKWYEEEDTKQCEQQARKPSETVLPKHTSSRYLAREELLTRNSNRTVLSQPKSTLYLEEEQHTARKSTVSVPRPSSSSDDEDDEETSALRKQMNRNRSYKKRSRFDENSEIPQQMNRNHSHKRRNRLELLEDSDTFTAKRGPGRPRKDGLPPVQRKTREAQLCPTGTETKQGEDEAEEDVDDPDPLICESSEAPDGSLSSDLPTWTIDSDSDFKDENISVAPMATIEISDSDEEAAEAKEQRTASAVEFVCDTPMETIVISDSDEEAAEEQATATAASSPSRADECSHCAIPVNGGECGHVTTCKSHSDPIHFACLKSCVELFQRCPQCDIPASVENVKKTCDC